MEQISNYVARMKKEHGQLDIKRVLLDKKKKRIIFYTAAQDIHEEDLDDFIHYAEKYFEDVDINIDVETYLLARKELDFVSTAEAVVIILGR